MKRSCGIILPIFSLPSPYGIGTLGQAAYDFIDFLKAAGQSWWQMLPLGPTGYGDSPYQSFSTYAGNPYFIDPELLLRDCKIHYNDKLPASKKELGELTSIFIPCGLRGALQPPFSPPAKSRRKRLGAGS